MKYAITGHCGMIGTFLKKELDKKHECILTMDIQEGVDKDVNNSFNLHPANADIVFHLAAYCKINNITENPHLAFLNARGMFNVLEFCRKNNIKKIVNFSTSRVLSKEENPYTASKKYGEHLLEAYRQCYGIEFLNIRPSTVYGPMDDKTGRLITNWCRNAIKGKELRIYGDENKTLDFTYVSDFVDGVMLLLDNWEKTKNQSWDISGGEEVKLEDLAVMISNELTEPATISYLPPEVAQPQQVKIDISKIKKLGYNPKVKLREGIKKMIEFYKNENKSAK